MLRLRGRTAPALSSYKRIEWHPRCPRIEISSPPATHNSIPQTNIITTPPEIDLPSVLRSRSSVIEIKPSYVPDVTVLLQERNPRRPASQYYCISSAASRLSVDRLRCTRVYPATCCPHSIRDIRPRRYPQTREQTREIPPERGLPVKRDEMPTTKASLRTNYKIAFLNPDQYLEYYIWGPFVPHELQEMFLLS